MQEEIKKEELKYITIDDFAKVEIKLGTIVEVNIVEGSDKLYKLSVDFGEYKEVESEGGLTEKERHIRTVFSGIRRMVTPEDIMGKQFPFVTNLAPRKMMGEYSEAMILAASEMQDVPCDNDDVIAEAENKVEVLALFNPSKKLSNGVRLR